jgi:hypothetical protein
MDWLSSDHVGTPTDTHAKIEGVCFLCVVRAERIWNKIGKICSVKPVLTEDLCAVQKEDIFNNMLYV